MTDEERSEVRLLAIDLGLYCGWAAFNGDGRLLGYGSRHFGGPNRLRLAVPRILDDFPRLKTLVVEGGGTLASPWEKEAARREITFKQVYGETWRAAILNPSQRRSGRQAKAAADGLARDLIARSGAPRPTSLKHDAAEAILIGFWASQAANRSL